MIGRTLHLGHAADSGAYCRDLDNWPRSWMGRKKTCRQEELVVCFRPFIEHLASSSLSSKTILRHVDNLWIEGGEIVRELNYTPSLRKVAAQRLLREAVHADGGPLIHNGSERCNTPSMRPAANSTASSVNLSAEPRQLPANFPDEALSK